MTNERISSLAPSVYDPTLLVPTVDLGQPSGSQNTHIALSDLAAAIGMQTVSVSSLGLIVPNGTRNDTTNVLAYQLTDPTNTSNAMLLSVEFSIQTNIGTLFNYAIFNGNPTAGGAVISQNAIPILTTNNNFCIVGYSAAPGMEFANSANGFLLNSELKAGIYVQIQNLTSSGFAFDAAFDFMLMPSGSTVALPIYDPPVFTTTIPLASLMTVDVGPGQTFPEMADAMPYVAPGFTMNVHSGSYYKPFIVPTGYDGFTIQAAAGASADTITCNGRGGYYTGLMYDYTAWTGNLAYSGTGPKNPFRLAQGKGFALVQCGGTVSGLGFRDCGGGYTYDLSHAGMPTSYEADVPSAVIDGIVVWERMGGEAAVYVINANSGTSTFTTNITRCTFDGGANGIFVPNFSSGGGPGTGNQVGNLTLNIDHCDFSTHFPCGNTDGGLAHNVYVNAQFVNVTNSNFYGCYANTLKSRSPNLTITNCFLESWCGRCIDWPEGGNLVVNNTTFTQKFVPSTETTTNYIGMAAENNYGILEIGGMVPAQFNNCTLNIGRYSTYFLMHYGQSGVFTNVTQTFFPNIGNAGGADAISASLAYDTVDSTVGTMTGVFIGINSAPSIAPATVSSATSMPTPRTPMHNAA